MHGPYGNQVDDFQMGDPSNGHQSDGIGGHSSAAATPEPWFGVETLPEDQAFQTMLHALGVANPVEASQIRAVQFVLGSLRTLAMDGTLKPRDPEAVDDWNGIESLAVDEEGGDGRSASVRSDRLEKKAVWYNKYKRDHMEEWAKVTEEQRKNSASSPYGDWKTPQRNQWTADQVKLQKLTRGGGWVQPWRGSWPIGGVLTEISNIPVYRQWAGVGQPYYNEALATYWCPNPHHCKKDHHSSTGMVFHVAHLRAKGQDPFPWIKLV